MSKHTFMGGEAEVIDVSDMAVQVGYKDDKNEPRTVWIPRSLIDGGDALDTGDTDIQVAKWYAIREDLPHDD